MIDILEKIFAEIADFFREKGIKQSMSRKGNWLDNSCVENFFDYYNSIKNKNRY